MIQSTEELISTDLLRTNKRISNKILPVGQPKFKAIKKYKTGKSKTYTKTIIIRNIVIHLEYTD
jgi:hypothetical protein